MNRGVAAQPIVRDDADRPRIGKPHVAQAEGRGGILHVDDLEPRVTQQVDQVADHVQPVLDAAEAGVEPVVSAGPDQFGVSGVGDVEDHQAVPRVPDRGGRVQVPLQGPEELAGGQLEDPDLRAARLLLVEAIGHVVKAGLNLLGIEVLEEM